jgi:microcompartment protein CcmK/EutM
LVIQDGFAASSAVTGQAGAAIDSAIIGIVDEIELEGAV